ncbi:MAG: hypothetical protein OEZ14_16085, partial [Acidimicrobiia bacterium]|nr:hypothetical protein [Acidimicrobiia bacterium]
ADYAAGARETPTLDRPFNDRIPVSTLRRVEETIRRLEAAPPPRSITVALDDAGMTKVTVSVLADGVRITVPEGSAAPASLVGDLERSLSARGFDLSGQNPQQRHQHAEPDETLPFAVPPRRPERSGVRI